MPPKPRADKAARFLFAEFMHLHVRNPLHSERERRQRHVQNHARIERRRCHDPATAGIVHA